MTEESGDKASAGTKAKRILLVDDDSEIVESMRIALEAKGYEVLVARDGNQGLAWPSARIPIW